MLNNISKILIAFGLELAVTTSFFAIFDVNILNVIY